MLHRLLAGLPVGSREIKAMGVGGLLRDLPERPLPRAAARPAEDTVIAVQAEPRRISAVILAVGRSSRMGHNKLLIDIGGRPLVRHITETVLAAKPHQVVVVVGHEADQVRAALADLNVALVENIAYREGLSTSLQSGVAALQHGTEAALICLGDMPGVDTNLLRRLMSSFNPVEGREIVVPTRAGKRGNPVLWSSRFFADLMNLKGDVGARHLIGDNAEWVAEVDVEGDAIFTDLDTQGGGGQLEDRSARLKCCPCTLSRSGPTKVVCIEDVWGDFSQ